MFDIEEGGDAPAANIEKLLAEVKEGGAVSDERFHFVNARTQDFIPRTRKVPYSFGKRETYFTKAPNRRSFRKRRTQRPKGARSHIRNYRPEIPVHNSTHSVDLSSDLELILLDTHRRSYTVFLRDGQLYVHKTDGQFKGIYRIGAIEKFDYDVNGQKGTYVIKVNECIVHVDTLTLRPLNSAIQLMLYSAQNGTAEPRYDRRFSNEEPQTMPKIPYRDIRALRQQSGKQRRAQYMFVNGFNGDRNKFVEESAKPLNHYRPKKHQMMFKHKTGKTYVEKYVSTWAY